VSPRKSWSVSMVLFESAMMELSSLTASVTLGAVSHVACLGSLAVLTSTSLASSSS
jgi:hypothetical protein